MGKALGRSVVTLPDFDLSYDGLLLFLEERFPYMPVQVWVERILDGKIELENGEAVTHNSKYPAGTRLFYYREVGDEQKVPFQEEIIFCDEHLLVVFKPHFLPVVASGPHVHECLVHRLKVRTGNMALSPLHRIDRETAGIVLFSANRETRGLYQEMFMEEGRVRKTYEAICSYQASTPQMEWCIESRLEKGEPWFRMQEVPGKINARTSIRLMEVQGQRALFELHPLTGKKHQLRLHLSSLGFPIVNDRYYPRLLERREENFTAPLQLLAREIAFQDPLNGRSVGFEATRHLSFSELNVSR